jgi:alkylated DNA repair dioxygenase AlkB
MVPGLHYAAGWVDGETEQALLEHIDSHEWITELRRRVQHYGHRYDYGSRAVGEPAEPIPDWASALSGRLVADGLMDRADQVIVNEYLPGQGIGAHVDCVPCFGPVVAAVSLGSAYTMDFLDGTQSHPVRLERGSLCVMTGPARYTWKHRIAGRMTDPGPLGRVPRGRRVSITFRTMATG